jgi:hypothetical protein
MGVPKNSKISFSHQGEGWDEGIKIRRYILTLTHSQRERELLEIPVSYSITALAI